jgi:hypothetical protein
MASMSANTGADRLGPRRRAKRAPGWHEANRARTAIVLGLALGASGCEVVNGLNDLTFVPEEPPACVPEPPETSCEGASCGVRTGNCGQEVACDDLCMAPFSCGVGVGPDECGCSGGPILATPPPPEGCTPVMRGTRTYYFCATMNFEDGREFCRGFGTDLVVLQTIDENDFVAITTPANSWIGLYDPDGVCRGMFCDFEWVDGTTPGQHQYVNWNFGEPNNVGGGEHCVEIQTGTGGWNDVPCSNSRPVICETTCPEP